MLSLSNLKLIALTVAIAVGTAPWTFAAAEETIADLPPVIDEAGNIVPGGFASLEKVALGGVDQWILIRAQDTAKPVLLILHGGPGGSLMPWVDLFQPTALEENFVVVHWDQRGAAKSFDPDLTADDLQVENYVADTLELTDILRNRFDQDKIFLHGHSWGSALGFMTIAENSEPYHAYIPAGERVNWIESYTNSFEWVKAQAVAAGNTDVLSMIAEIEPFDASDPEHQDLVNQGQEIFRGGDVYTEGLWENMLDYAIGGKSPYYTTSEINNYIPGLEKSSAALADFVGTYDLASIMTTSTIPVHFMVGEHDHNTAADLSGAYYETLEASAKSFTVITGAGHSFMYEKPDEWAAALINIKNETLAN